MTAARTDTSGERSSILVIGASTLDRLLHVQSYPKADSKTSCTTHECGGGNAANTASAIARLSSTYKQHQYGTRNVTSDHVHDHDHDVFCSASENYDTGTCLGSDTNSTKIQLLTKVSTDRIGQSLIHELQDYGVDLSSPLFCRSGGGSSICTVVVTTSPPHTRTCFFDPGSVGTLMPSDIQCNIQEEILKGALHIHSDTRHTQVASLIAHEAKHCRKKPTGSNHHHLYRTIRLSVDVERDRESPEFDELIDLADIVFTNEDLMQSFVQRRLGGSCGSSDAFLSAHEPAMSPHVIFNQESFGSSCSNHQNTNCDDNRQHIPPFYVNVATLCRTLAVFSSGMDTESVDISLSKDLVVTRGKIGATHCTLTGSVRYENLPPVQGKEVVVCETPSNQMKISQPGPGVFRIDQSIHSMTVPNKGDDVGTDEAQFMPIRRIEENIVIIHSVGPPIVKNIVDTTGCGDSFIGGYLFCQTHLECRPDFGRLSTTDAVLFRLRFASWVAGKKIGGVGARNNLPTFDEVVEDLGHGIDGMKEVLREMVLQPE